MNKTMTKGLLAILSVGLLLPFICSCSFSKKNAVLLRAASFAESLKTADAGDILRLTDGLDRDYKKEFKEFLDVERYDDEELLYASSMMHTMNVEIDGSSVKVRKDTATVDIEITIADHEALKDGDYKDADALAEAIKSCSTRSIPITVEFVRVDKEWYVANFDEREFKDIYSFLGNMPVIGRSTLIETAKTVAESVVKDDPSLALSVAASLDTPGMTDMPSYLNDIFDTDGKPSAEDKAFREAVLSTMTYEIDESKTSIEGHNGTVVIYITMADYSQLANQTFKKVTEIAPAVEKLPVVTYSYTCEFVRVGSEWFATNLDAEEYADFLLYKNFSISLKKIDGTYKATVDITDKFVSYVSSEYGIKMPSDLSGRIVITATLVLKDGKYEVTVDRDAFVKNIKAFVEANIDKIIMNMLGTTSSVGLDTLAKLAGYQNYADMRQSVLNDVTTNLETINTSGLESSGTFTFTDDKVTLTSGNDTIPGTIDNYGVITVTSPVNDPDARKLLGSDTITLPFKKA